jgi:sigma-B regulation protein RsbU (phosphoserine phosphatase)
LVVDDNDLSRLMLVRALEQRGLEAFDCRDGMEALQIVESYGPLLLVLDYEMPELTGAQVCEIVRQNKNPSIASLPIILLTSHAGEEHEIECLRAGADDFVSKPVNVTILKARIETHLRLHSLRAQLQAQNDELEQWRRSHEADLEAARLTQQAIIPQRLPELSGWELAAHYEPVMPVGGDIYDWIRLADGAYLFWIADATGHGAAAALVTTLIKLVFRRAAEEASSPGKILERVNAEFFSIFRGKSFMTAACLVIRPDNGKLAFAGAGHPPLFVAHSSHNVDALASQAPPLGIQSKLECREAPSELYPGDTALLYTDGLHSVIDARGRRMTPFELPALLPKAAPSAAEFLRQTIDAAVNHAAGRPLPDDLAAIALRRM